MNAPVTACICTHNPNRRILGWCLDRLRAQELNETSAELIVIDNASNPSLRADELNLQNFPFPARIVREEKLGLSQARCRGVRESKSDVIVFVDDDNLLAPDFLRHAGALFQQNLKCGAAGGKILAKTEIEPPPWFAQHAGMLAVMDHGNAPRCLSREGWVTPTGAGLVVRKSAFEEALSQSLLLTDRRGKNLSSGGDTEICCRIRGLGWELWYDPRLQLEHFLPASRLTEKYLERLSFGFGASAPYIEFYSSPNVPHRRWLNLRRAFFHFRRWIGSSGIEAANHLGLAQSLVKTAFGPALWKDLERFVTRPETFAPPPRQ